MNADAPAQSPGWYQDPDLADGLRYWDGTRWTDRRRPKPDWVEADGMGRVRSATGPAPSRWSTRKTFALVVAIGFALCAFVWLTIPKRPGRTVEDRTFLAAAADLCQATLPELRAERRPERRLSDTEVASRIDQVADELDDLVANLDDLPVASADQDEVDKWLRAWAGYIDVGRDYADAIRTGDAGAAEDIRARADDDADAIGRFASGNRIDSCIPFSLS